MNLLWPDHLCGLRLRVHAQDLATIVGREVDATVWREHAASSKLSMTTELWADEFSRGYAEHDCLQVDSRNIGDQLGIGDLAFAREHNYKAIVAPSKLGRNQRLEFPNGAPARHFKLDGRSA